MVKSLCFSALPERNMLDLSTLKSTVDLDDKFANQIHRPISDNETLLENGRKHLVKGRKCLFFSISFFSHEDVINSSFNRGKNDVISCKMVIKYYIQQADL